MDSYQMPDTQRPTIGQAPDPAASGLSLRAALAPWLIAGYLIIGGVFIGLGGWASTAPIAQAVVANGTVKVDSNRKRVQHQEGGTVREIFVRDGDRVSEGDVLVRLDETRAKASLGIVAANYDAEIARTARLESERDGAAKVEFPVYLTDRADDPAVAELLTAQTQLFEARRNSLGSGIEILTSQIKQLREKKRGTQSLIDALLAVSLNFSGELGGSNVENAVAWKKAGVQRHTPVCGCIGE